MFDDFCKNEFFPVPNVDKVIEKKNTFKNALFVVRI